MSAERPVDGGDRRGRVLPRPPLLPEARCAKGGGPPFSFGAAFAETANVSSVSRYSDPPGISLQGCALNERLTLLRDR